MLLRKRRGETVKRRGTVIFRREKMTQYLPPNLLALFAPRDPIPYLPPSDKLPHEKKTRGYLGVGNFLGFFEVSVAVGQTFLCCVCACGKKNV